MVSPTFILGGNIVEDSKTSVFANSLIWFGAAVSIAEIITGTLVAPLGFAKGFAAVLIGHVIGCIPLYMAGLIGARSGKSAMESVSMSFGRIGGVFFAMLNVTQLVGWTAVMIISGGRAVNVAASGMFAGVPFWCVLIGALVILWIMIGITNLGWLNIFAMGALFVLTVVLSFIIFDGSAHGTVQGVISFGNAVELSAAMPLSWMPLISDYTRHAKRPKAAAFASVAVYFVTSCWMYAIGLGAAIFTGDTDIAKIMLSAGLGLVAVFIIIVSTVTTTFLDAYSAGVSFMLINSNIGEKRVGVLVAIVGTALAIFTPIEQYENFLFLIGSVFAPMISVLIVDFFFVRKDCSRDSFNFANLALWAAGFVLYRIFMGIDTPVGSTLPVMAVVCLMSAAAGFVRVRAARTADR